MDFVQCPGWSCRRYNSESAVFCWKCGSRLPDKEEPEKASEFGLGLLDDEQPAEPEEGKIKFREFL